LTVTQVLRYAVRRVLLAAGLIFVSCDVTTAQSASAPMLTAAFLFNFAKFTVWPADAPQNGPLTICVSGDPIVVGALQKIVKGRPVGGRDVTAASVSSGWRACHVLYSTGLDASHSQQIIDELKGVPVLTVSDRERFTEQGGMVRLFADGSRLRFSINTEAADRSRLHFSSRVLVLATRVGDKAAP
jgi:hypothetical protein